MKYFQQQVYTAAENLEGLLMKKLISILVLLICLTTWVYSQRIVLHYYAYIPDGIRYDGYYKYERMTQDRIIEEIQIEEDITLFVHTQYRLDSVKKTERIFFEKLDRALNGNNKIDLLYLPENREIIEQYIAEGHITAVNDLIRKHAPRLYRSYPEKFWKYRENTRNIYSVPMRKLKNVTDSGYWVIKNVDSSKDIRPEYLLEELFQKRNTMIVQNQGDYLPPVIQWLRHEGYIPVGLGEFVFDPAAAEVLSILELPEDVLNRIVQYNSLFNLVGNTYNWMQVKFKQEWNSFYNTLEDKVFSMPRYLINEIISQYKNKDHLFSSDAIPVPFSDYEHLYIPTKSENSAATLKLIDNLYSTPEWYFLLYYGTATDEDNVSIANATTYYSQNHTGVKDIFQVLGNDNFYIPPDYLPEIVREKHTAAKKQSYNYSGPIKGFDMNFAYNQAVNELINQNEAMYYRKGFKPASMATNYLRNPYSDEVKQFRQELITVGSYLQRQIDRYIGIEE